MERHHLQVPQQVTAVETLNVFRTLDGRLTFCNPCSRMRMRLLRSKRTGHAAARRCQQQDHAQMYYWDLLHVVRQERHCSDPT